MKNATQSTFEEIMIGSPPPLRIEYARVPVEDVRLDRDNPRLKYQQALNPEVSLSDLLFQENDTRLLKVDIKDNGIIDPPYIRRDHDGKYTVIEGNRRIACVHALRSELPADSRFSAVYSRILPADTPEAKQALLMAQFHVAGKLKWNAHEKAGHIYDMYQRLKVSMDQLKSTLHMGEPAIKQTFEAYRMLTERYAVIDEGRYAAMADGKWSFFAEFYKIKGFRDKVMPNARDGTVADPFFGDRFCRWVGEGRIPRAEDVRKLPAILDNAKSHAMFESYATPEHAFQKALEISEVGRPASRSKFFKAVELLVSAGLAANMEDISTAATNDIAKKQLADARAVLDNVSRQASIVQR